MIVDCLERYLQCWVVSLAGYLGLVQVSARDGGKLERGETVTRGESLIDINSVTADLVEEEDEKS